MTGEWLLLSVNTELSGKSFPKAELKEVLNRKPQKNGEVSHSYIWGEMLQIKE